MNYGTAYERLMERARTRRLEGYVERHHVVPRCLGGADVVSNKVRLTPEEHYVAHQLLVKMHPGNHRLLWAAFAMTHGSRKQLARSNNKLYGWLRRALAKHVSEQFKGRRHTDASRAKMRAAHLGKKREPHTAETKAKMSSALMGRMKSPLHRAALSAAKSGKKRGPHSDQHRQRLGESLRNSDKLKAANRAASLRPEYRAKQSAITTQVWARRRAEAASRPSVTLPAGGL